MPLVRGCRRSAISENVRTLIRREKYPPKQAVAIALSQARKTGRGKCLAELGPKPRRKGRAQGSKGTQSIHVKFWRVPAFYGAPAYYIVRAIRGTEEISGGVADNKSKARKQALAFGNELRKRFPHAERIGVVESIGPRKQLLIGEF